MYLRNPHEAGEAHLSHDGQVVGLLKLLELLRRSASRPLDVGWLVPSPGGAAEAAAAREPLPRLVAELVIGGASSEIRKEAAGVLKAVWRLLEGQSSVEAQQVLFVAYLRSLFLHAGLPVSCNCSLVMVISCLPAMVDRVN